MSEEKKDLTTLFAVRTTISQEKSVANMIFSKLRMRNPIPDIKVILVSEQLRGYVFIEATHQRDVMEAISGVRHVKGKIVGQIKLEDISHVIVPRKVTEILEEGDVVEIVSGLFQNQRARIERMPREGAREEVLVRLIESESPISIKVHGDFLKLVEKGTKQPVVVIPQVKEGEVVDIFGEGFEEEEEEAEAQLEVSEQASVVAESVGEDDWTEYEDEDEEDDWTKFDDLEDEETY
ncbi:MAG: transcription elongation factor Spt5 [Promethearchaeota archaeon]